MKNWLISQQTILNDVKSMTIAMVTVYKIIRVLQIPDNFVYENNGILKKKKKRRILKKIIIFTGETNTVKNN